jgi:predicted nuclease of predicted toxin-antitoxin system
VKFKTDENLPNEAAALISESGHDVHTVWDEALAGMPDLDVSAAACVERRILITLDTDFANVHAYPSERFAGIVVLRPKKQDKVIVATYLRRLLAAVQLRSPVRELWIVEKDRIRVRRGE